MAVHRTRLIKYMYTKLRTINTSINPRHACRDSLTGSSRYPRYSCACPRQSRGTVHARGARCRAAAHEYVDGAIREYNSARERERYSPSGCGCCCAADASAAAAGVALGWLLLARRLLCRRRGRPWLLGGLFPS